MGPVQSDVNTERRSAGDREVILEATRHGSAGGADADSSTPIWDPGIDRPSPDRLLSNSRSDQNLGGKSLVENRTGTLNHNRVDQARGDRDAADAVLILARTGSVCDESNTNPWAFLHRSSDDFRQEQLSENWQQHNLRESVTPILVADVEHSFPSITQDPISNHNFAQLLDGVRDLGISSGNRDQYQKQNSGPGNGPGNGLDCTNNIVEAQSDHRNERLEREHVAHINGLRLIESGDADPRCGIWSQTASRNSGVVFVRVPSPKQKGPTPGRGGGQWGGTVTGDRRRFATAVVESHQMSWQGDHEPRGGNGRGYNRGGRFGGRNRYPPPPPPPYPPRTYRNDDGFQEEQGDARRNIDARVKLNSIEANKRDEENRKWDERLHEMLRLARETVEKERAEANLAAIQKEKEEAEARNAIKGVQEDVGKQKEQRKFGSGYNGAGSSKGFGNAANLGSSSNQKREYGAGEKYGKCQGEQDVASYYGSSSAKLGFMYIKSTDVDVVESAMSQKGIFEVLEGTLTGPEIEKELKEWPGCNPPGWKWYAHPNKDDSKLFTVRFHSVEALHQYCAFKKLNFNTKDVAVRITPLLQQIKPIRKQEKCWFQISGIPMTKRTVTTVKEVVSLVGRAIEVDEANLTKFAHVRALIVCNKLDDIPLHVDGGMNVDEIYRFYFKREIAIGGTNSATSTSRLDGENRGNQGNNNGSPPKRNRDSEGSLESREESSENDPKHQRGSYSGYSAAKEPVTIQVTPNVNATENLRDTVEYISHSERPCEKGVIDGVLTEYDSSDDDLLGEEYEAELRQKALETINKHNNTWPRDQKVQVLAMRNGDKETDMGDPMFMHNISVHASVMDNTEYGKGYQQVYNAIMQEGREMDRIVGEMVNSEVANSCITEQVPDVMEKDNEAESHNQSTMHEGQGLEEEEIVYKSMETMFESQEKHESSDSMEVDQREDNLQNQEDPEHIIRQSSRIEAQNDGGVNMLTKAIQLKEKQNQDEKLSSEDNATLDKEFTESEIWNAIEQMEKNKAPGPDGRTNGAAPGDRANNQMVVFRASNVVISEILE